MTPFRPAFETRFDVPAETAFDYLADPRNRPEWQSSLRGVEMLDEGVPRIGMRWRDLTAPGLKPTMVITVLDRAAVWAERGTWRGFEATLMLEFAEDRATSGVPGCVVTTTFRVSGKGILRPVGALTSGVAPYAVRGDLKRAARILSARGDAQ
jgi:Polyketide cyclase / dehydrase and lipid transport